jgi:GlcNAc-PI de-N-acetylase
VSIAILSPHFDDAVLSCWHLLEESAAPAVVNVFTGAPPPGTGTAWWDQLTGATDSATRMLERREEDVQALAATGATTRALDLLDDQYRTTDLPSHVLVARICAAADPGATLYAPAALDGHPDHALVRDAALCLAGAGRRVVLYADLPHAIRKGWPSWVSCDRNGGGSDVALRWNKELAASRLDTDRLVPRVRPLGAAIRARKLRALAAYKSQREALDGWAFAPLDDPRTLGWEVSWEVPRSALGRTHESCGETLLAGAGGEAADERA